MRNSRRISAGNEENLRLSRAGGRWRVSASISARRDPSRVPRSQRARRVGHVLHPSMGDRSRAAAARSVSSEPNTTLSWTRRCARSHRTSARGIFLQRHCFVPGGDGGVEGTKLGDGCRLMIRVERFAGTAEEWDAFAVEQAGYTHFHRFQWRTVIENVFGHECLYLAARDSDGSLSAILPLVRVCSVVFGRYLVSMPFLNYGGPLGTDDGIQSLVNEAVAMARKEKV